VHGGGRRTGAGWTPPGAGPYACDTHRRRFVRVACAGPPRSTVIDCARARP